MRISTTPRLCDFSPLLLLILPHFSTFDSSPKTRQHSSFSRTEHSTAKHRAPIPVPSSIGPPLLRKYQHLHQHYNQLNRTITHCRPIPFSALAGSVLYRPLPAWEQSSHFAPSSSLSSLAAVSASSARFIQSRAASTPPALALAVLRPAPDSNTTLSPDRPLFSRLEIVCYQRLSTSFIPTTLRCIQSVACASAVTSSTFPSP